jgi:hypothetical protein
MLGEVEVVMIPAYHDLRFRAELPHGGLPESFMLLSLGTEFDPEIMRELEGSGKDWFPSEIENSPGDVESSAGVICAPSATVLLAKRLKQPFVLEVYRGTVRHRYTATFPQDVEQELIADGRFEPVEIGAWDEMAAAPRFHFRGPFSLLEKPATAFLCSTQCPGDKILEAYEWARHQCDTGGTVISGFHTPVEKDVLAILVRRGANILWVPARDLPKTTPKELKFADDEGRLMILSPFAYGKVIRPSRDSCAARNRFVIDFAQTRHIPHVAVGSSLAADLKSRLL